MKQIEMIFKAYPFAGYLTGVMDSGHNPAFFLFA